MQPSARVTLLFALSLATALLPIGACSGDAFEAASGGSSSGGTSTMNGGSNATGGGDDSGARCAGPEDCSDNDSCTNDFCTTEGKCASAPKCASPARCCDGDCAECCEDTDCDDHVACTTNTCFAGKCMYVPDDAQCAPTEACSITEGCKTKVACTDASACQDASLCTTDTCAGGFCKNQYCDSGSVCCPSTGCAEECCDDSQCQNDDPCMVGSCQGGRCTVAPRCATGELCCPSADKTSANCGSCCTAKDCDDNVGCTDDSCTGAHLACVNTPSNATCGRGEVCNPDKGCIAQVQCQVDGDCKQAGCGHCTQGVCQYTCADGQACCAETNSCAACCGNASCDDKIDCTVDACGAVGCSHTADDKACTAYGAYGSCQPQLGGCVECLKDTQCDDGVACTVDACDPNVHKCTHTSSNCGECKTSYDCQTIVTTAAAQPPIIGTPCPTCVDGKCQTVSCQGTCCPSGCHFDLCPE